MKPRGRNFRERRAFHYTVGTFSRCARGGDWRRRREGRAATRACKAWALFSRLDWSFYGRCVLRCANARLRSVCGACSYQSTIVCDVSQVGYQLSALRACIGWQGGRRRRGTEIFKNETQKRRDTPQRPNGVSSLATAVARACDRPARFYALRSTPTASRYHPTSDISRSTQHRTALQLSTSPLLLHTAVPSGILLRVLPRSSRPLTWPLGRRPTSRPTAARTRRTRARRPHSSQTPRRGSPRRPRSSQRRRRVA